MTSNIIGVAVGTTQDIMDSNGEREVEVDGRNIPQGSRIWAEGRRRNGTGKQGDTYLPSPPTHTQALKVLRFEREKNPATC